MPAYDYHDYALADLSDLPVPPELESPKRKGPRGGVNLNFPRKLHNLLEEHHHDEIISWSPHGRCFTVHKPTEFVKSLAPKYFQQSKLNSFQRQLNLYGFTRILSPGPDKGGWYHECFLRGRPELCVRIVRKRVKGACTNINPDLEPRFYTLPPLPQSPNHIECNPVHNFVMFEMLNKSTSSSFYPASTMSSEARKIRSSTLIRPVSRSAHSIIVEDPPFMDTFRGSILSSPVFCSSFTNDRSSQGKDKTSIDTSSTHSHTSQSTISSTPLEISTQDHDKEDYHSSWDDSDEFKFGLEDDLLDEAILKLDEKISPLELALDLTNVFDTEKKST